MIDSKTKSLIESFINILIWFLVGLISNIIILPLFWYNVTFIDSTWIALIFTLISLIRSYTIRRMFVNWIYERVFNNKKYMKILTQQEAIIQGLSIFSYNNWDFAYEDKKWISHLIRKNEEIAKGKFIFSYDNLDFKYEDENWITHLIRNNKEIAKWLWVHSYDNWDYEYKDEKWISHLIRNII